MNIFKSVIRGMIKEALSSDLYEEDVSLEAAFANAESDVIDALKESGGDSIWSLDTDPSMWKKYDDGHGKYYSISVNLSFEVSLPSDILDELSLLSSKKRYEIVENVCKILNIYLEEYDFVGERIVGRSSDNDLEAHISAEYNNVEDLVGAIKFYKNDSPTKSEFVETLRRILSEELGNTNLEQM